MKDSIKEESLINNENQQEMNNNKTIREGGDLNSDIKKLFEETTDE